MQSRREFLKGILSGLGALTALPFIAGKVKASEVFDNQPASLEEELAKMFLDVGEGKMQDVEAISIMKYWKKLSIEQNKLPDFVKAMKNAFKIADKANSKAFEDGFDKCCKLIIDYEPRDIKRGWITQEEFDGLKHKSAYAKTMPFKRPMPRYK